MWQFNSTEQDVPVMKRREVFSSQLLGSFDADAYFRAVYVPYSDEDVAQLQRQMETGEPAHKATDYRKASCWEEKRRILMLFTTAYHEAFHYFQRLVTSYGVFDQYARNGQSIALLDLLARHNGLPGKSLNALLREDPSIVKPESALSPKATLLTSIQDGACLCESDEQKPSAPNSPFRLMPVRTADGTTLFQVGVEVDRKIYPFGARVLKESWAYTALKAAILRTFGDVAAEDYAERLGVPFFPYKLLDYLIEQHLPKQADPENSVIVSYLGCMVAYFGLNHEVYAPPDSSIGRGFFPGYRAALLLDAIGARLATRRSFDWDVALDAWDCALALDKSMEWTPFVTNAYWTHDRIVAYMSEVTQHKQTHIFTFDFGAFARFMGAVHTALLTVLSDTSLAVDIVRWMHFYSRGHLFRPPVSMFIRHAKDEEVRELRVMSENPREVSFWGLYYIVASILRQKWASSTWHCPLAELGASACETHDASVCDGLTDSFDLADGVKRKDCVLVRLIERIRKKEAGACLVFSS